MECVSPAVFLLLGRLNMDFSPDTVSVVSTIFVHEAQMKQVVHLLRADVLVARGLSPGMRDSATTLLRRRRLVRIENAQMLSRLLRARKMRRIVRHYSGSIAFVDTDGT